MTGNLRTGIRLRRTTYLDDTYLDDFEVEDLAMPTSNFEAKMCLADSILQALIIPAIIMLAALLAYGEVGL